MFELTKGYDIVYTWFDYLKSQGHYVSGYVLMPNHFHVMIGFRQSGKSINLIVGNGKRFMAYELIKRLKETSDTMLDKLKEGVSSRDYKRGKLHEVFQSSFDWKECRSNRFINQKLSYMHDNPCRGKWKLVGSPVEYVHSSARFYQMGAQGIYLVDHVGMLEDIDLSEVVSDGN